MYEGKRILAVVPARGGSKGIPLKNLRQVSSVSLVARAGQVAKAVSMIDCAIVSTDHDAIAAEAVSSGLKFAFRRPEALSGSLVADWDVLNHALQEMETLEAVEFDIIVMLQPTSPSRKPEHVEAAIAKLVDEGLDAVWSVSETDSKAHPLKQLSLGKGDALSYYDPAGSKVIARQQLTPLFHRNGIVYAFTRDCIINQRTILGQKTAGLLIDEISPNIDTELDLLWCDFLISRGLL